MAPRPHVDYGVYLVTDSTPAILGERDIVQVVKAGLQGGVTCVQYRDKTTDHAVLIDTARRIHAVCKIAGVPLLINDHVDVAVEIGCEGVHIGQDDIGMPNLHLESYQRLLKLTHTAYGEARKQLGPDKIIGVTASSQEEALKACEAGADYLGIGTVYATQTYTQFYAKLLCT